MVGFSIGPKIDLDGNNSCRIVSWPDGSCRPAHETEIALWAENESLRAELEAVKVHSRKQAEDIMKLGPMVYDDSAQPVEWKARAEAAESELARLKDRVAEVRGHFRVEYAGIGGRPSIGYDSEALPKVIAILEAALTTDNPGGDTAREGGDV